MYEIYSETEMSSVHFRPGLPTRQPHLSFSTLHACCFTHDATQELLVAAALLSEDMHRMDSGLQSGQNDLPGRLALQVMQAFKSPGNCFKSRKVIK
jgi:hypothetical protein